MAWTKGTSGNPAGRPPSEKAFADLLRVAVREQGKDGVPQLRKIVDQLVKSAVAGEAWAIQQVADRLDGRPAQMLTTVEMKREASDWSTAELLAIIDAEEANGSSLPALPAPPTFQTRHRRG